MDRRGSDERGTAYVEVPVGLPGRCVEMVIVWQEVERVDPSDVSGWPPGWFENTGRSYRRSGFRAAAAGELRSPRAAAVKYLLDTNACIGHLTGRVRPNDLLIAAMALAHRLTLVTENHEEFGRVPGLRIENWES